MCVCVPACECARTRGVKGHHGHAAPPPRPPEHNNFPLRQVARPLNSTFPSCLVNCSHNLEMVICDRVNSNIMIIKGDVASNLSFAPSLIFFHFIALSSHFLPIRLLTIALFPPQSFPLGLSCSHTLPLFCGTFSASLGHTDQ